MRASILGRVGSWFGRAVVDFLRGGLGKGVAGGRAMEPVTVDIVVVFSVGRDTETVVLSMVVPVPVRRVAHGRAGRVRLRSTVGSVVHMAEAGSSASSGWLEVADGTASRGVLLEERGGS